MMSSDKAREITTMEFLRRSVGDRTEMLNLANDCHEEARCLRAQLAQANTALAERDAQLAADGDVVRQLSKALNPMTWTKEMSDAWHKALPDTQEAFRQLHLAAVAPLATRQPTQDKGE